MLAHCFNPRLARDKNNLLYVTAEGVCSLPIGQRGCQSESSAF